MKKVTIYTDGSCSPNPGVGGLGVVLLYQEPAVHLDTSGHVHRKEISTGYAHTTNNRMELRAVIEGLSALKYPCEVAVVSDSRYVVNAFNEKWIYKWAKYHWKKYDGDVVINSDLWKQLLELYKRHKVVFSWVQGHSGHLENERANVLANEGRLLPRDQLLEDLDCVKRKG